jgi:hypothetical protein
MTISRIENRKRTDGFYNRSCLVLQWSQTSYGNDILLFYIHTRNDSNDPIEHGYLKRHWRRLRPRLL